MKINIALAKTEQKLRIIEIAIPEGSEASANVPKLLYELQMMGNIGASREIKINDWEGRSDFYFDGDGRDKIKYIKVDGVEFKPNK